MIALPSSSDHFAQAQPPVDENPLTVMESPVETGFATSLKLTQSTAANMMTYGLERMREVGEEMGRQTDGSVLPKSWMGLRVENKCTYDNDLEWRRALGGIFTQSNFTLGNNRRYARLLSARVRADLLGTSPFFGCMSRRNGNVELTRQVESYVQEKVELSNVPKALREGLKTALICNEAVIKTTYLKNITPFLGPARVAIDQTGRPIVTPNKRDYIYPNDGFLPDPNTRGLMRLVKDPSFVVTQQPNFQQFTSLPQKQVIYDGVFAQVLDARDFLCPLKFSETWEADINVHLYEEDPSVLRLLYGGMDTADTYFAWRESDTGFKAPRRMQGEYWDQRSSVRQTVLVAEIYLRYDADGDTIPEEVYGLIDVRNKQWIFYDYLANHMPKRPFSVIVGVEREEKRWYGKGVFTKMYSSGLYIDTQINRVNEKSSQNSSVTFRHKNAVDEWKAGEQVRFGERKVYNVNEGWDAKNRPPLFKINTNAEAELDLNLVDRFQNASDSEFGVITQQSSTVADQNASKTATGVMSTERDASVLSQDTETEQIVGIEDVLWHATHFILDQMDPVEMQYSKDGKSLAAISKDEANYLERDVKLLLTKTRSTALIQTNAQAEAICLRYYQLDPMKQQLLWDLYVNQLKGLEVDNAEQLLHRPTDQEVQQWNQQQQAQAQAQIEAQKKPPAASIAAKLTDFEVTIEQPQIKEKFFEITPATPELIAEQKASEDAAEVAKKGAEADLTAKAKADHAQPPKQPVSKR